MKSCPTPLIIREMQIKTTMRYHFTPVRMLLSKSLQAINAGEGVEKRELSYTVGGIAIQYRHCGEQCGDFLKNWKYNPAIPLLGIHTKETRIERDTCTPVFIAALFIIAKTWKQPRCPSADEWIRKLWYIYTMYIIQPLKRIHLTQF